MSEDLFKTVSEIAEAEIQAASIEHLRTAPNRGGTYGASGLTPEALKKKFDELPRLVKDKLHELIAAYNALVESIANGVLGDALMVDGVSLPQALEKFAADLIGNKTAGTITTLAALSAAIGDDASFAEHVAAAIENAATAAIKTTTDGLIGERNDNTITTLAALSAAIGDDASFAEHVDENINAAWGHLSSLIYAKPNIKVGGEYVAEFDADAFGDAIIADLTGSAPELLDTIHELSAALGDDPNFAVSVFTAIEKIKSKKADYDAVFGYNIFDGGKAREENGISITSTSFVANGTVRASTETTIAQFCPRSVIGETYTISYYVSKENPNDVMRIGWMHNGQAEWLEEGSSFVLTEEMAGQGFLIEATGTGLEYGPFSIDDVMLYKGTERRDYEPCMTLTKSIAAELEKKLNDTDIPNGGLVERKSNGAWGKVGYSYAAAAGTLAMRDVNGKLAVGKADGDRFAVPLSQMNEALAEKNVEIGILKKRVVNLEQGITPDPYLTDDSTAYVKDVPADALPFARLDAVGGMTHKIITELPIDPAYLGDLWAQDTDPVRTVGLIVDMFPGAEVGKTYTLAYDVTPSDLPFVGYLEPSGKFTLTANTELVTNCSGTYDEAAYTTFTNVRLVEPTVLRETKVTAIESVGKNLLHGYTTTTQNGVTFTVDAEGAISLSGTASTTVITVLGSITFPADDKTTRYCPEDFATGNWPANTQPRLLVTKVNGYGAFTSNGGNAPNADILYGTCSIRVRLEAGHNYTGCKLYPMLVKGTTPPTEYIPYRKHTFPIPAEVQALDGYGWGFPRSNGSNAYNSIEFDDEGKATFVKRVERKVFTSADFKWEPSESANLGTYFNYGAKDAANGWILCNKLPQGQPKAKGGKGCYVAGKAFVFFIGDYATTLAEWKAQLDAWAAEGDPFTVYYELAEPIVTDVSAYFTRDNFIEVEGGGVIIAQNENADAAPTAIKYQLKEG